MNAIFLSSPGIKIIQFNRIHLQFHSLIWFDLIWHVQTADSEIVACCCLLLLKMMIVTYPSDDFRRGKSENQRREVITFCFYPLTTADIWWDKIENRQRLETNCLWMSGITDQVPLFEDDEDIGHRAPRVKWFACVGVAVVGILALVIAISVSYRMSPDIHNVTTIMPGPGNSILRT